MRARTHSGGWRLLGGLALGGVLCWAAGFGWFLHLTMAYTDPPPPHVDGVVALTGGAGRVELALRLLASGEADELLVSGIGGNTDLAVLGRRAGMDLLPYAARITLGRQAASTRGNAMETATWAAQNRIRSIIVVTAPYHMPRALAELRQALPVVPLFPLPVQPPLMPEAAEHGPSLRLQAEEFTKFLLTVAGLSPWLTHRDPIPPARPAAVTRADTNAGASL